MGTWATGITFTDSMLSDGSEMVNMMELGSLTATDLILRDSYDSNTCICALNATEKLNATDRIPGHGSQTIQNKCVCCYRQYPWQWFRNDSICLHASLTATDGIPGDGSANSCICMHL